MYNCGNTQFIYNIDHNFNGPNFQLEIVDSVSNQSQNNVSSTKFFEIKNPVIQEYYNSADPRYLQCTDNYLISASEVKSSDFMTTILLCIDYDLNIVSSYDIKPNEEDPNKQLTRTNEIYIPKSSFEGTIFD